MITLHFSNYWLLPIVALVLLVVFVVSSRGESCIEVFFRFIGLATLFLLFTIGLLGFNLIFA